MARKKTTQAENPQQDVLKYNPQLMYIVSVSPGSAAGKSYKFSVPAERLRGGENSLLRGSVEDLLKYGLEEVEHNRAQKSIVSAIKREMQNNFGFTVNTAAVARDAVAGNHFVKKEVQNNHYMGLDLIVASEQTGGTKYFSFHG